jgi:hypothetical protein
MEEYRHDSCADKGAVHQSSEIESTTTSKRSTFMASYWKLGKSTQKSESMRMYKRLKLSKTCILN